jgi:predicted transglutaminase-like cysteine proteinase
VETVTDIVLPLPFTQINVNVGLVQTLRLTCLGNKTCATAQFTSTPTFLVVKNREIPAIASKMPFGRDIRRPASYLLLALFACSLVVASADFERLRSLANTRYGSQAAQTVDQWQALIDDIKISPDSVKLVKTNDFFNTRIRFVDDIDTWQRKDYWATPLEFIGRRQGDCEDFSIAKYVTLLLAGVDMDKLRITYVKARLGGPASSHTQAHMVLAYYPTPGAEPQVLDNIVLDVRPASLRSDLTPVFGFNSRGLWVGGADRPASNNPGAKLSRWRGLLQRMEQEGIK